MNNLDYLNLNSLRNYPIKDGLSRISRDDVFTIPNTLIVDLSLCSVGNDSLDLYISSISVSSTSLTIEISELNEGVFGTFQSALPLNDYNNDLIMVPSARFPSATGIITIGSTEELSSLPSGNFIFDYTNTALLMRVYSPSNPGLSWLTFSDNKGNKTTLTGDIQINGHSNIQFRVVDNVVYMDAGENLGLNKICSDTGTPIITINGVPGDANGNFTLIPERCVTLDVAQYGLLIGDNCGQPCMGCSEIDAIATHTNELESSIIAIKNFVNRLQTSIDQATTLLNYQCQCN